MARLSTAGGLDRAVEASATWTRRNALLWSAAEPEKGKRDWAAVAALEAELAAARASGLEVILIVRGVPAWALGPSGKACGPIRQDELASFASFVGDAAARYAGPPYNVRYWELWNEPDVDPALVPGDGEMGCWGNDGDADYGGAAYAGLLKAAYPSIKAANPDAQVLVGGLLLDCDPAQPQRCRNPRPPFFLRGILRAGGGAYFDGVSFHAYDYWGGASGTYHNPGWGTISSSTGPALAAKAEFLRKALAEGGAAGKYLLNTESAMICPSCNGDEAFEAAKAWYVPQVYAAAMAAGLRANIWYSALGWRSSGLITPELKPLPAHTVYKVAAAQLGAAVYVGRLGPAELGADSRVIGHRFSRADGELWLLWSSLPAAQQVTLARAPTLAIDALGSEVPARGVMVVDQKPLYLLWK